MAKSRPKASEYVRLFKRYYPDAHCALHHESPEQLLVATVLSAQCTDERVNQVTKVLFKKYPDMQALSKAPVNWQPSYCSKNKHHE